MLFRSERGVRWPVIILTGHGDVPIAVQAMKAGVVDFLEKPFDKATLLRALTAGFGIFDQHDAAAASAQEATIRIALTTVYMMKLRIWKAESKSSCASCHEVAL